jgi:hypothetical protein
MRKLLVACAAAGSLLVGTGAAAASPALAQPTSDSMTCLGYTFANGVCNMGQAQAGQAFAGPLETSASDGTDVSVSGTVPPGMQVPYEYNAPGTILWGTPTTAGTYTFTVSGTDYSGVPIAPMTYQITIVGNFTPPPVTITDSPVLPAGTVNTNYDYVFNVSGGSIPYTWTVLSGQLPFGLYLQSGVELTQTGDELAGTPDVTGTYTFTMQVTDGAGNTASKQFTLTIGSTPPPPPPPPGHHHGQQ